MVLSLPFWRGCVYTYIHAYHVHTYAEPFTADLDRELEELFDDDYGMEKVKGTNLDRVWSAYWGAHQKFFHQLCCAAKVSSLMRPSTYLSLCL